MNWARYGNGSRMHSRLLKDITALWETIGGIKGALHCSEFVFLGVIIQLARGLTLDAC